MQINAKFITIEGSEGSGKSTTIKTVADYLRQKNLTVISTREPGGTLLGEKIRDILLNKNNINMYPDTELLLMFAARSQHWQEKILPNLEAGSWVISDRFVDSSFAYQGGGRGMDMSKIQQLSTLVLGNYQPDLTIYLDIEPKIGLQRAKNRGEPDRFEMEKLAFFNKVRGVFLARAKKYSHFSVVDANQSESNVKQQVIKILDQL